MSERHVHTYTLKIRRIRADNVQYVGSTGDKAFILQVCKCGNELAIDYGALKIVAKRYKELIDAQRTKVASLGEQPDMPRMQ